MFWFYNHSLPNTSNKCIRITQHSSDYYTYVHGIRAADNRAPKPGPRSFRLPYTSYEHTVSCKDERKLRLTIEKPRCFLFFFFPNTCTLKHATAAGVKSSSTMVTRVGEYHSFVRPLDLYRSKHYTVLCRMRGR